MTTYSFEPPIDPPLDVWKTYEKPMLIEQTILDICQDILKKGAKSRFSEFFDSLYQQVEENIEEFLPEQVPYDE